MWVAAFGAEHYDLVISGANDCSNPLQTHAALVTTSQQIASLADGSYYVCVDAVDHAGNRRSATPVAFIVDTAPPASFSISGPATPGSDDTPTISWTAATGAASYDVVVAAAANCSSPLQTHAVSNATTVDLDSLADGSYYACVAAADQAGNRRSATPVAFVVDTTPPVVALGPRRIAGNSFTLRPTVSDRSAVTYNWTKISGPGTITFGSPTSKDTLIEASAEGDYVLRLTATDQVGLSSHADVSLSWDLSRLVSLGRHVSCAISAGGILRCWGRNKAGDVGDGSVFQQNSPVVINVGVNRSVLSVAVGAFHTCALLDDSSVRCWGGQDNRVELGYGDGADRITPSTEALDFGAGRNAVAVSAGYDHNCAILDDGSVKCWGQNTGGKLGYGDTTARAAVPSETVDLGAGRTAVEISLGQNHSCARLDDGSIKCWGLNSSGQLGYGDTTNRETPPASPVSLPGGLTARHLRAGSNFTCAILTDDTISCWGLNTYGQLGDRSTTQRNSPVLVTGFTGVPKRLTASYYHVCAVRVDGTVSCWANVPSVIGAGRAASPTDCSDGVSGSAFACAAAGHTYSSHSRDCSNGISVSSAACAAAGGIWAHCSDFTKVSQGSCTGGTLSWNASMFAYCSHSGGAKTASVFCTDSGGTMNANGYCGDPSYLSRPSCLDGGKTWHLANVPGPNLDFGAGRSVVSLEAGFGNAWMCAVLDNFDLKCWGDNGNGQLGYGDAYVSSDFTSIDLGAGQAVQSVQIATSHVCALTNSGVVKCWGNNSYGKLGIGHYTDTSTPTTVPLAGTATQIATHNAHACALLADGTIQCWGYNSSGRLGSGASLSTLAESPSPVTVAGLGANAIQVGTGSDFTCALLVDGAVKCWGSPTNGRLGYAVNPATYCSDGIQTTASACTTAGGTWNVSLYGDCSNGISTSQAACQAVSNGTWAHCSNGIAVTSGACTGANVWNPTLYQYCTTGATPTTAATFCTNNGGSIGNYGYCSDSSYRTRADCSIAGKTWHVYTRPGPAIQLGNVPATQIAVSNTGACALLQSGSVRCWGQNNYLQIGVGDTTTTNNYLQPAAAIDFGAHTVQKLAAGLGHYCAILEDQTLRCWGGWAVAYGQLGYSPSLGNLAAPPSESVNFGVGRTVLAIAPGSDSNLSCALLDDNSVRCFGNANINFSTDARTFDNMIMAAMPLGTTATPTVLAAGGPNALICVGFADGSLRCAGNGRDGGRTAFPTLRFLPPASAVLNLKP